jgi:hypothetical protein
MTLDAADENALKTERWATGLLIFVAIAVHSTALLNAKPLQSANDRSRWCTVWSLVERGTFQIDEIREQPGWDSIDIIRDDGHFYSTKPPLLSVIVAGLTWCVQRATQLFADVFNYVVTAVRLTWCMPRAARWTLLEQTHAVTTSVLFVVNILPFAVSLVLLSRLLKRVAQTAWCRLFVLSTAGFGTLVTPYLMTLNNHTVAVAGVMISLFALERVLSEESPNGWYFAVCGLTAGWACANELPAAAFGLATFVLAAKRSVRQTVYWYAPAALVPIVAFLATNFIATGSWKPTYANFGSEKYNFVYEGVPSYWMDPDGVDRNVDSPWVYFVHSTVGHHGIFSLTPLFLLSLIGWCVSGSVRLRALRILIRVGAVMSVLVIGFYLTRFDNYNYGGVSCGLRWAVWLIPFWLLAMVPIVDAAARFTALRWLLAGLLGASVMSAWLPVPNPWQQPWLFHKMEAWKWIDYTRKPDELPRKLWTWFPSIPEPVPQNGPTAEESPETPWVEFTSQAADGSELRRRLTCRAPKDGSSDLVEVEVSEAVGDKPLRPVRNLLIDVESFVAGAPTADFVRWSNPAAVPLPQKLSDMTFVRALPLLKAYRAGKVRYLRLPLRNDAFRCQTAAAAVDFPPDNRLHQYRCDTWLCDEFPFGVAQYEIKVTDLDTGGIVHSERWTVSDCFPAVAETAPPPLPKK